MLCPNYLYNDMRASSPRRWSACCPRICRTCSSPTAARKPWTARSSSRAWSPKRPAFVADDQGLSRPDDRRAVGDVGAEVSRGLSAAARNHARAVQRRGGARQGGHRPDGGSDPRSGPGRERRQRRHAGFPAAAAAALPRARRAADRRRDPDRLRPHRHVVRDRARRHRARHHVPGQGPRRRLPDGRARLHEGDPRGALPGRARQHVRRLAAGLRGRPGRDRGLSRRGSDRAQRHGSAPTCCNAAARRARGRGDGPRHPRPRPDARRSSCAPRSRRCSRA